MHLYMNKTQLKIVYVVIGLMAFIGFHLNAEQETQVQRIKVAVASNNFDALTMTRGRFQGALGPIFQCIFDNTSFQYEFWQFPHARVVQELQSGNIDLGLPLAKTPDRDKHSVFNNSVYDAPLMLFSNKKVPETQDLTQLKFVLSRSRGFANLIDESKLKYYRVNNWQGAVELVKKGRFDATFIPKVVLDSFDPAIIEGTFQREIASQPVGIYLSKKSQQI